MSSLPAEVQEDALWRVASICVFRREGLSEEEIAAKMKYRGIGHMRQELEQWGMPTWFVEGDAPPAAKKPSDAEERRPARERWPKNAGKRGPLPPAEEAIGLLRLPLDDLIRSLEQLRGRDEWKRGGLFFAEVERDGKRKAAGGDWQPPKPLPQLAGAFALVVGADDLIMYKLLEKLHPSEQIPAPEDHPYNGHGLPDPEKVNLQGLRKNVEEMRRAALNVATIMRGGEVGPGRKYVEVPPRLHAAVGRAKEMAAEGASVETIRRELNEHKDRGPLSLEDDYTDEEIRWMLDTELDAEI